MFPILLLILSKKELDKVEEIVRLYEHKLFAFAKSIVKDVSAAEDVVQETFCEIIKNIGKIDDVSSNMTKSYLNTILYHRAIDYIRKRNRKEVVFEEADDIALTIKDPFDMDKIISNAEFGEELSNFVSKLSRRDQELIELKFRRDLSNQQIAKFYKVNEETIKKRWFRAKQRLVQLIDANGGKR